MTVLTFSESKVEYASHQLSLWYGQCPHQCKYCFVNNYRQRNWNWAVGPLRKSTHALNLARLAPSKDVTSLVISFTNESLPPNNPEAMPWLVEILTILINRHIPVKVLTKNSAIRDLASFIDPSPWLTIGCSITTNIQNIAVCDYYEPRASSIERRLGALKYLKMQGFRTWVSCEPLLPQTDLDQLFEELYLLRPLEIWIGKGNYHKDLNWMDWHILTQRVMNERQHTGINYQLKGDLKCLL